MATLQPNGPPFAQPLSTRAAQMLQELQGKRLLSQEIPVMQEALLTQAPEVPSFKKNTPVTEFRKQDYLDETRTSFLGRFLLALFALLLILFLSGWVIFSKLEPELRVLHKNNQVLSKLGYEMTAITQDITKKTETLSQAKEQFEGLLGLYPDQDTIYSVYTDFLTKLEGSKNSVLFQTGTITQSQDNPLLQETLAELTKDSGAIQVDAKKTPPANSSQKPVSPQNATTPKKSDVPVVVAQPIKIMGEIKPGLNYYHLSFKFEGTYVGYLTARQVLVNENPAMIVQFEDIRVSVSDPSKMSMTVLYSIPFFNQSK